MVRGENKRRDEKDQRSFKVPTDLADKEEAYHSRLIARENLYMRWTRNFSTNEQIMLFSLNQIHNENSESRYDKWKTMILQFEEESGLGEPTVNYSQIFNYIDLPCDIYVGWNGMDVLGVFTLLRNSLYYNRSVQLFIFLTYSFLHAGYGNIACKTTAGKWATMIYAIIGIPIMIIIINDLGLKTKKRFECDGPSILGQFLMICVRKLSAFLEDIRLYLGENQNIQLFCNCLSFSCELLL